MVQTDHGAAMAPNGAVYNNRGMCCHLDTVSPVITC